MFIVTVGGKPQHYDGKILSFCSRDPTIFCSYEEAGLAITRTLEAANEKEEYRDQWAIVRDGWRIETIITQLVNSSKL